jgi:hypothetical protein
MRLAWRFLPLLLCIALTSCAKEPVPPPSPLLGHTGNYEARAVIRRDDFEAEAVVSHLSPANCDLVFSAPEHLAGMAFVYGQDVVTVEYDGLSFPFDSQSIPEGAVAEVVVSALQRAIQQNAVTTELRVDGAILRGEIEAGSFLLSLTPNDNRPPKLLVPGAELEIEFTDFTFLD